MNAEAYNQSMSIASEILTDFPNWSQPCQLIGRKTTYQQEWKLINLTSSSLLERPTIQFTSVVDVVAARNHKESSSFLRGCASDNETLLEESDTPQFPLLNFRWLVYRTRFDRHMFATLPVVSSWCNKTARQISGFVRLFARDVKR